MKFGDKLILIDINRYLSIINNSVNTIFKVGDVFEFDSSRDYGIIKVRNKNNLTFFLHEDRFKKLSDISDCDLVAFKLTGNNNYLK